MKTEKILSLVLWLVAAALGLWGHVNLPDLPIADHFGLDGTADGYHPRDVALAIGPGMSLVMILALLWLLPAIMPKAASPKRSPRAYGIVVVAVTAMFVVIEAVIVLKAAGAAIDIMKIIMFALGLLFVIMGNYLPKMRLNYLMGIRTPWTLSDERVWDKTHRLAGPLFVAGGAVAVAAAFLPQPQWRFAALLIALAAPALISVIYSYLASRRLGLS